MKLAEETTVVCDEEVKEEEVTSEVTATETKTFEVPSWVQAVQGITQGIGLCIGVILALPFIAISRGIEWYQSNKKKVEK